MSSTERAPILVGADGSASAATAVSFADRLAGLIGTPLLLVAAFPYEDVPSRAAGRAYRRALEEDAEATLRRMRALAVEAPSVDTVTIGRPSAARALHELAADAGARMIVVGSTHVGRFGRVLPGSTGERLLHGAPCPVTVVPHGHGAPESSFAVIGAADDGRAEAGLAVAEAAALARSSGAALRVIGVCPVSARGVQAGMDHPLDPADLERRTAAHLAATLASLPDDVRATSTLAYGDPAAALVAETEGLDVLVMGSRGYGPVRAVLLGGVSGVVMREAACPVIVVPRGAAAGELQAAGTVSATA